MKAVITVIGEDKVGIIAKVATLLAEYNVNILDISQTTMQNMFTMIMFVNISACTCSITDLADKLEIIGNEMALSMRIQHEDIFNSMHKI